MIYLFLAVFWSLWEQSNGQTWTLQATRFAGNQVMIGVGVVSPLRTPTGLRR